MRSITDVFVRHPVLALVVNLALILVGGRLAFGLPVQQYPKLDSASVIITTVYTGASAETVRGFLTTPIERAVSAIGGIDHVESESRQGVSMVTIRLELGYDTTRALAEVTARLQQVRSELPSEAEDAPEATPAPKKKRSVSHCGPEGCGYKALLGHLVITRDLELPGSSGVAVRLLPTSHALAGDSHSRFVVRPRVQGAYGVHLAARF